MDESASPSFLDNRVSLLPPDVSRFNALHSLPPSAPESFRASQASAAIPDSPRIGTPSDAERSHLLNSKEVLTQQSPSTSRSPRSNRVKYFVLFGIITFVIVALAVILPIVFVVIKPNTHKSNAAVAPTPIPSTNPGSDPVASSSLNIGFDGSTVTMANGSTFLYENPFGGYWVEDPSNPYNNDARAQEWVPPLNQTWTFGVDQIRGVNLGEPFIVPALFEKYQSGPTPAIDEWTLSLAMRADTSPGGGISQLEVHYQTFITEQDFANIAGAGLSWIRLPIPYWAIETWPGEPFLANVCWTYILQALAWAHDRDLKQSLPGSQNGYNHSGKFGQINFMNGVMGIANAERTLYYIRVITEFISQPEYSNLIPIFGFLNEPFAMEIGKDVLSSFYVRAYETIRNITGVGEGNGPYLAMHDGFLGVGEWANFLPQADRLILDTHPYFAFDGSPNTQPLVDYATMPCTGWADSLNNSRVSFGITIAGEFSNAVNDCGLWVRGVGGSPEYGGNCDIWNDASQWNSSQVAGLKQFALSSMDSIRDYFFWTWRIGVSTVTNTVAAPFWSYELGLQTGVLPKDPREADGACASLGVVQDAPFVGTYSSWQTGGVGANQIPVSVLADFPWPPLTLSDITPSNAVTMLPTYTDTGSIKTLPTPTYTFTTKGAVQTVSAGDGWFDPNDTEGAITPIAGCTYPDPWSATNIPIPTPCVAATAAKRREVPHAKITPPPS
ncbi:hypothetical protein Clacol_002638 [Clathrus columnatus]|uniref:glucan 1,3-beta-glucosidase n=1 Tax=Clathrus columnatus TaxID=1419009 RepID=A0AAV5A472_9AGAM|nr:hypothetical protein Clacol_002638 [Clathrus columnatus]